MNKVETRDEEKEEEGLDEMEAVRNSRGTRRQLRKTIPGESSEITGGDDSIAIGNDGDDRFLWKRPARDRGL